MFVACDLYKRMLLVKKNRTVTFCRLSGCPRQQKEISGGKKSKKHPYSKKEEEKEEEICTKKRRFANEFQKSERTKDFTCNKNCT